MGNGSALTHPDAPARVALLVNGFCYRMSYVWAKVALMGRGLGLLNPYVRARAALVGNGF